MLTGNQKFIEKMLPVNFLNEITRIEVHNKRPIYEIHRWWARRPGSIFRAIILGTFLDKDLDEAEFKKIFYQRIDLGGKIILDPMIGGGTTVVEGNRLNCRVIGIDINPVAWFVTKKELEPVDDQKLLEAYKELEKNVAPKIRKYYITSCSHCGVDADIVYTFWVRKIKCVNCRENIPLFTSLKLAEFKGRAWIFCPHCHTIFVSSERKTEISCPGCNRRLMITREYLKSGSYICPKCGQKSEVRKAVRKALDFEMFAIEYYCPVCKTRAYKTVDQRDIEIYEEARREFEKRKEKLIFPKQEIPDGKEVRRLFKYRYNNFYQFFNERQLLSLAQLAEAILKIEDKNVREFMLLTLSDCLDFNNMFARYNQKAKKIEPMFAHHAFYPKNMPAENNVWGTKYGRCSFSKCFKKTLRGKMYCKKPYELWTKNKKTKKIHVYNDSVEGKFASSFDDLIKNGKNTLLRCQTAENLSFIPDNSIDAVITDPPYFDNVMYSELADFYFIWLRMGLKEKYEWFKPEYSPRTGEVVVNKVQNKDKDFFIKGLAKIFKECYRVLKNEALMIFTFHHKEEEAWCSVLKAILDAGFFIKAIYPVYSEMRTSFHIMGKNAISYDTIIVCGKRLVPPIPAMWPVLLKKISAYTEAFLRETMPRWKGLTKDDVFVIASGKCLELYSKHYPSITKDGEKVTIVEAIHEVGSKVKEMLKNLAMPTIENSSKSINEPNQSKLM